MYQICNVRKVRWVAFRFIWGGVSPFLLFRIYDIACIFLYYVHYIHIEYMQIYLVIIHYLGGGWGVPPPPQPIIKNCSWLNGYNILFDNISSCQSCICICLVFYCIFDVFFVQKLIHLHRAIVVKGDLSSTYIMVFY